MNNISWSPIWLFTLLFYSVCSLSPKQGFNDKFMNTWQQLTNTIYKNSKDQSNLKLNTSMLWSKQLEMPRNPGIIPTIIKTNNHLIMLNNMDLWVLEEQELRYKVTLLSSFDSDVEFIKGIDYQGRVYLLVCFQNSLCNLYSATSAFDVTHHQTISDDGDPTDAKFFIQQGKLYLTILFHEHAFSNRLKKTNSRLRIFEWHNLYMDPEDLTLQSKASCISSFDYKEDIILVLGCPGDESMIKFPTQVWSRKPNGKMTLVQYLPTDRPTSINHFVERGENFIIVLEKNRETSIYWWEGNEFVQWLSVDGLEKYFQLSVSSDLKSSTLLSFSYNNVLRMYLMTSVKLNKLYETQLSNGDMETSILKVAVFEEGGITYMVVLTRSEANIYISLHKINILFFNTIATEVPDSGAPQSDTDREALDTVYRAVTSVKHKMETLYSISASVLLRNKNVTIRHGVVTEKIDMASGEIKKIIHSRRDIAHFIRELSTYRTHITDEIDTNKKKLQQTPLYENRQFMFKGKVNVKKAKINSLTVHIVNGEVFEPNLFLSVGTNTYQRLKSIKANKLVVEWLAVKNISSSEAEDFMVADSRVNVPISVSSLETRNLRVKENMTINNITAKDLSEKLVSVVTEEELFNRISQLGAGKSSRRPEILKLQDNTLIENLNVDSIDGVSINQMLTSIFVHGINDQIYGNVHFQDGVRAKKMAAKRFNFLVRQNDPYPASHMNIPPREMYIPPAQINIHPYLNIPPPFKNNPPFPINFPTQLQPQIPLLYRPHPRPMPQYPQYWTSFNPFTLDGRRKKRENIPETETFMYIKKLKIMGNLKVARLLFQNSSLLVNGHKVPTSDLGSIYWTNTTTQEINEPVHFSQGLRTKNSLTSQIINGKNISCYATRASNLSSIVLENMYVVGDVSTKNNSLVLMPENEIQGYKNLTVLNVKNLEAREINGENIESMLQARDLLESGISIVTGNLKVGGTLEADLINGMDVKQKLKSAIMIDSDFELDDVELKTIRGDNINVTNLNNHSLQSLMKFSSIENSIVYIHGDIKLSQLSKVSSINKFPADFSKVVNKKEGATIYGKKKFETQVTVLGDLKLKSVNNIDIENHFSKLLKKSKKQEVTGFYTIQYAEMKSNFNVSTINGISSSSFVFCSEAQVKLQSGIKFKSIAVDGNISSSSLHRTCQMPKVEDETVFGQSSKWSTVEINGDSSWPKEGGNRLQHMFESVVTSDSDQTITGNLTVDLISVPNIQVHSLNDKNMSLIFEDSLLRQKKNQVISGKKTFLKLFNCQSIKVEGDAKLDSINDIDVNDIDERLVRHHGDGMEIISGHKTFMNGFKAFSFECQEGINGIKAENIVSRKFSGEAPPVTVQSLKVYNSLLVETVHDVNLKDFFQDCIYLNHAEKQRILGQLLVKGNVSLQGDVTVPSINEISTNDIVFSNKKKKPVRINSCKIFSSDVIFKSNPNIHILNHRNLIEAYRDNVKIDQNVTINGSVEITSEVELATIFAHEYFVGPKKLIYLNKTILP